MSLLLFRWVVYTMGVLYLFLAEVFLVDGARRPTNSPVSTIVSLECGLGFTIYWRLGFLPRLCDRSSG